MTQYGTMRLDFRPVSKDDLVWCSTVLEDGFEKDQEVRQRLPGIWKTLLNEEAMVMSVLEDHDFSGTLVAFGATVFVSDRFVQDALATPEPNLALRLLEREASRRNRAILRPPEIRKQSLGKGLNLLILHYSELVDRYSDEDRAVVRDTMVYGLVELHRRSSLNLLLYEVYGEADVQYVMDSGARLVSDFAGWYATRGLPLPAPNRRPYLLAINRKDALKHRAAWMAWLFLSQRSKLGLSPAEQKLIARALAGETDTQLTHNPEISPNTVRRHWRSVIKKFETAGISWLLGDSAKSGPEDSSADIMKYKKKRPFILNYLRQHPEELRPQAGAHGAC